MNEIAVVSTAAEIRANVNLIQEVMRAVMKEGEHYGVVPGCGNKKTLLKPGAEKILSTFRIAADPVVEDLSNHDEARYRVTVKGTAQSTGTFLGAGIGECSSSEEKYKWKAAVCDKEYDVTFEDRKRVKYTRDGREIKQIRTNPADVANTVLKMAKKRAQIDMTLTVTAASDIFTQDIEDVDDLENAGGEQSTPKQDLEKPKSKSAAAPAPAAPGEMRKMAAKYPSKCGTCGGDIKVGEEILYDSANKKAHHPACINKPEEATKEQIEF